MTSKNIEDDCWQIYQKSEIVAKTRMPDVFVILWDYLCMLTILTLIGIKGQ